MQDGVIARIRNLCGHITRVHELTASVKAEIGCSATFNTRQDGLGTTSGHRTARPRRLDRRTPRLASEDLSGSWLTCSSGPVHPARCRPQPTLLPAPNHSPHAYFDDAVLPIGATLLIGLTRASLQYEVQTTGPLGRRGRFPRIPCQSGGALNGLTTTVQPFAMMRPGDGSSSVAGIVVSITTEFSVSGCHA